MTLFSFIRLISAKLLKYIAGFFGVMGVVLWAYLSGRKSRQRQWEKDNANATKRIFEESTKSPKSKDDLIKRIREKGL
ncbi:MAG: hypothetical protein JNK86_04450 [Alphaproteobacteria bacterium]|nr:hypothetical protein [Alphaproteobacteria bacterium]